jgi:hypothetical protein
MCGLKNFFGLPQKNRSLKMSFQTPEDKERLRIFWTRVYKTDTCWFWIGTLSKRGYGWFGIRKQPMAAHRVSWIAHFGEIPDGLEVLHKCDTPQCVNPEHLEIGTHAKNIKDALARGTAFQMEKDFCLRGHDLRVPGARFTSSGTSRCRKCHNLTSCIRARAARINQPEPSAASRQFETDRENQAVRG